jgi:hypothetical protein
VALGVVDRLEPVEVDDRDSRGAAVRAAKVRADEFSERLPVQQACCRIEFGACLDVAQLFAVGTIEENKPDREEREREHLEQRGGLGLTCAERAVAAVDDERQRSEREEEPRAHAPRSASAAKCRDAERRDRDRDRKVGARDESLQRHAGEHARDNATRDVPIVCMRGFNTRRIY